MSKVKELQVVQVTWVDSVSHNAWAKEEDLPTVDDLMVVSVGILVMDVKSHIVLSTSYHEGSGKFVDPITIPRCAVSAISTLKTIEVDEVD